LLQELKVAKADGSYLKALNKLSRLKLLVIDDLNALKQKTALL